MWRSLEARRSGGPEVASSNLAIPTNLCGARFLGKHLSYKEDKQSSILWPRTSHAQVAELGMRAALRALWGSVPMQVRLLS